MKVSSGVKFIAVSLSVVYFSTQCAFAHSPETVFWHERRAHQPSSEKPIVLASLPLPDERLPLANSFNQFSQFSLPRRFHAPDIIDDKNLTDLLASLPVSAGRVQSVHVPKGHRAADGVVVHIQDVHFNQEAQRNIASVVQSLSQANKVAVVGLEGASGVIDLSSYQAYDDRDAVQKVADYLLLKNDISGPIHAAMTAPPGKISYVGIDDPRHYQANINAYQKASLDAMSFKKKLARRDLQLAAKKKSTFNPALAEFDDHVAAQHTGRSSLGDYVRYLMGKSSTGSMELEKFTAALELEEKMDLKRVEAERKELLTQLALTLRSSETTELVNQSLAFRLGRINQTAFYEYLKDLCRRKNVELARYPNMRDFLQYVLLSDAIRLEDLFGEIKQLEQDAYASLIQSPQEKRLVEESAHLHLAQKLVQFSLTKAEWEEYKGDTFKNQEPGASNVFAPFEQFYQEAEIRDGLMAENFMAATQRVSQASILVTGGFHATGIAQALLAKGVVVIEYVPKITQIDTDQGSSYLSVFNQEKTPLEKLFQGDKLFLAKNPGAGLVSAVPDIVAVGAQKNPARFSIGSAVRQLKSKLEISITRISPRVIVQRIKAGRAWVQLTILFDGAGRIIDNRSEILLSANPIPELITFMLLFATGVPSMSHFMLVGVFIASAIIVRFVWMMSIFAHGAGHVAIKMLVDKNPIFLLSEITEGRTLGEIVRSLIPFLSIYTPGLSAPKTLPAGDQAPGKIRLKAAGGILTNLLLFFWTLSANHQLDPMVSGALMIVNAALFFMSLTDWLAIYTGIAHAFGCGVFFINAPRAVLPITPGDTDLLPSAVNQTITEELKKMAERGSHTAGGYLLVQGANGAYEIAGEKIVNGGGQSYVTYQRQGPHYLIDRLMPRVQTALRKAKKAGLVFNDRFQAAMHVRLASVPGKQVKKNAQPFLVGTKRVVNVTSIKDGRMVVAPTIYQAVGEANGDLYSSKISGKGKKKTFKADPSERDDKRPSYIDYGALGKYYADRYGEILGDNDSQVAALKLYSLRTQGIWLDSLHLAYDRQFVNRVSDERPSAEAFQGWADQLQGLFMELAPQLYLKGATSLSQVEWDTEAYLSFLKRGVELLRQDPIWGKTKKAEVQRLVGDAFGFFTQNDAKTAARIFMSEVDGDSTFGLHFISTLEPGVDVVISRKNPMILVHNRTKNIMAGGSVGSVVYDTVKQWSDDGDELRQLTLKMNNGGTEDEGGEIAFFDSNTQTTRIFSLHDESELSAEDVERRWEDPFIEDMVTVPASDDGSRDDIEAATLIGRKIERSFQGGNANWEVARKFADMFDNLAVEFERMNDVLQQAGITNAVSHLQTPILIITLGESGTSAGQYFADLMSRSFPLLHDKIKVVNANDYIADRTKYPALMTLLVDQGNSFPIVRAAELNHRELSDVRDMAGAPDENSAADETIHLDVNMGTEAKEMNATAEVLKLYYNGHLTHSFLMTPKRQTDSSQAMTHDQQNVFQTFYEPPVDGSFGLTWSQVLALTELHEHVVRHLREKHPRATPYGLLLTREEITHMSRAHREAMSRVPGFVGADFNAEGERVPIENAVENKRFAKLGKRLSLDFTELARATQAHVLYIFYSVVLTGGVFSLIWPHFEKLFGQDPSSLVAFTLVKMAFFIFLIFEAFFYMLFPFIFSLFLRLKEGRQLLRRMGPPALLFLDQRWGPVLNDMASSQFGLAKAVFEGPTYDARPATAERKYGKKARRGTVAWFRRSPTSTRSPGLIADYKAVSKMNPLVGGFQSIGHTGALRVGFTDGDAKQGEYDLNVSFSPNGHEHQAEASDLSPYAAELTAAVSSDLLALLAQTVTLETLTREVTHANVGFFGWWLAKWDRRYNLNSIYPTTAAPYGAPVPLDYRHFVRNRVRHLRSGAAQESLTPATPKAQAEEEHTGPSLHQTPPSTVDVPGQAWAKLIKGLASRAKNIFSLRSALRGAAFLTGLIAVLWALNGFPFLDSYKSISIPFVNFISIKNMVLHAAAFIPILVLFLLIGRWIAKDPGLEIETDRDIRVSDDIPPSSPSPSSPLPVNAVISNGNGHAPDPDPMAGVEVVEVPFMENDPRALFVHAVEGLRGVINSDDSHPDSSDSAGEKTAKPKAKKTTAKKTTGNTLTRPGLLDPATPGFSDYRNYAQPVANKKATVTAATRKKRVDLNKIDVPLPVSANTANRVFDRLASDGSVDIQELADLLPPPASSGLIEFGRTINQTGLVAPQIMAAPVRDLVHGRVQQLHNETSLTPEQINAFAALRANTDLIEQETGSKENSPNLVLPFKFKTGPDVNDVGSNLDYLIAQIELAKTNNRKIVLLIDEAEDPLMTAFLNSFDPNDNYYDTIIVSAAPGGYVDGGNTWRAEPIQRALTYLQDGVRNDGIEPMTNLKVIQQPTVWSVTAQWTLNRSVVLPFDLTVGAGLTANAALLHAHMEWAKRQNRELYLLVASDQKEAIKDIVRSFKGARPYIHIQESEAGYIDQLSWNQQQIEAGMELLKEMGLITSFDDVYLGLQTGLNAVALPDESFLSKLQFIYLESTFAIVAPAHRLKNMAVIAKALMTGA